MSAANKDPDDITLEELSRLIRILGMLGSSSDGEALSAARFAAKWVRDAGTDWRTLLSPPEEANPVVSVAVAVQEDAFLAREEAAYQRGYREGMANGIKAAAAQVKAQAGYAQGTAQARWAQAFPNQASAWAAASMAAQGPQSPAGGTGAAAGAGQGQTAQGPVRGSGAVPAGGWAPGSWQAVAQALLDRHATVPGVLRSREKTFVADVLARGFPTLTPAQDTWLRDIAGRNGMSW